MKRRTVIASCLAALIACTPQPRYELRPRCPPARDSFHLAAYPLDAPAIGGRVSDQDRGAPVAGAMITVFPGGRRQTSDSLGMFRFDSVAPGRYVLTTLRIGYARRTDSVEVPGGHVLDLRLPLEPQYPDRCPTVDRVRVR